MPIFISKLINVTHPCLHLQKLLLGLGTCAIRTQSSAPLVPANKPSDYRIFSNLITIIEDYCVSRFLHFYPIQS